MELEKINTPQFSLLDLDPLGDAKKTVQSVMNHEALYIKAREHFRSGPLEEIRSTCEISTVVSSNVDIGNSFGWNRDHKSAFFEFNLNGFIGGLMRDVDGVENTFWGKFNVTISGSFGLSKDGFPLAYELFAAAFIEDAALGLNWNPANIYPEYKFKMPLPAGYISEVRGHNAL